MVFWAPRLGARRQAGDLSLGSQGMLGGWWVGRLAAGEPLVIADLAFQPGGASGSTKSALASPI